MIACWLVSACRIVLLNAVWDARRTNRSTTAIASRMMTCFRLVRLALRIGAGVATSKWELLASGNYRWREPLKTRPSAASVGRFATQREFFEDCVVARLGFVVPIGGKRSARSAVRMGANP